MFSVVLYSTVTLKWALLYTTEENNFISISYPSLDKTNNSFDIEGPAFSLSQNRRFVIFACSIHATILAYTFYTPLTAASWKRIGYETIVVFVGDFLKPNVLTARLNLSRNYLKHIGAHIIDLQCDESYSIKLSQLVRVFSGFLPDNIVKDEDNIMTADSDLMPLNASEYQPTPGTHGFIFNAFCCEKFQRRKRSYRMFPSKLRPDIDFQLSIVLIFVSFLVAHIFLQKKAWRAIVMESKQRAELLHNADERTQYLLSENASLSFDMITLYSRHEFKDVYDQQMDKGDLAWYMDQILCSMLLTDYREKHSNFVVSERGRADRLDRDQGISFWDRDNFDQFGDAHLIHDDILKEGNWTIFNKLLKFVFNDTLVTLFNDYHKQYMIVDKVPTKTRRR
jgi:hypothetical protein